MNSREFKTAAVILATSDVFDADRLYLLVTEKFGKLRARARGVRKPTSKLTGHLLRFIPTELTLIEQQSGFFLITQAQTGSVATYPAERLEFLTVGETLAEGIDLLLVEREPHEEVFNGLVYTLDRLAERPEMIIVAEFFWKTLSVLGYMPEITVSIVTGTPLDPEELIWSSEFGGLFNRKDLPSGGLPGDAMLISDKRVVVALRQLAQPDFRAERIVLEDDLRRELLDIIFHYIQSHAGKPLKSWQMGRQSK